MWKGNFFEGKVCGKFYMMDMYAVYFVLGIGTCYLLYERRVCGMFSIREVYMVS